MKQHNVQTNKYVTEWRTEDGQLDREGGPAIEWENGHKEWWVDGKLHRLNGPAVEWPDGELEWWQNGRLHRLDGPAVECSDGTKEWYVDGIKFTEEEFNKLNKTREI